MRPQPPRGPADPAPVAAALDAAGDGRPVFFRDDDAGWDDPGLRSLLDLFGRHDLPVDVARIATELTPLLAGELSARAGGGRLRVHQHGYAHANQQREDRKCEFGDAVPRRTRLGTSAGAGAGFSTNSGLWSTPRSPLPGTGVRQ